MLLPILPLANNMRTGTPFVNAQGTKVASLPKPYIYFKDSAGLLLPNTESFKSKEKNWFVFPLETQPILVESFVI